MQIRATNNLSALLIETGQHKRAEKLLWTSLSEVKGADRAVYLYNLALALEGRGRGSEALELLIEAAGTETGSKSMLALVESRLVETEELQTVKTLRLALDLALVRGDRDFATWVVLGLLEADADDAGLTSLIRFLSRAEISPLEFWETWEPRIQPFEDRLSSEERILWQEIKALFSEPPSDQVISCSVLPVRGVSASAKVAFEELVQLRAADAYRSGDGATALCFYERLQSLNPENDRGAVYALTILTEEGGSLDPAGSRLLRLAERNEEAGPSPEVLLAQGDSFAALARRIGDPAYRQRADEEWRRGLEEGAESELANIFQQRLETSPPHSYDWIPNSGPTYDSPLHLTQWDPVFLHATPDRESLFGSVWTGVFPGMSLPEGMDLGHGGFAWGTQLDFDDAWWCRTPYHDPQDSNVAVGFLPFHFLGTSEEWNVLPPSFGHGGQIWDPQLDLGMTVGSYDSPTELWPAFRGPVGEMGGDALTRQRSLFPVLQSPWLCPGSVP